MRRPQPGFAGQGIADLRRHIFGADRLSLSRAEALTGFSRRTLKRHLPKGGWW